MGIRKINVQGTDISIVKKSHSDFLSLTDIATYQNQERSDYVIQNWIRNRSTIEFLGLWEKINNSASFNPVEFPNDGFWLPKPAA